MFIAFDGIDGAGKSSICKNIANELEKNYSICIYDMGKLGFLDDIIDNIKKGNYLCSAEVRECVYYLEGYLFSDLIAKKYLKDREKHILIDRYILSFMSYGPLNGMSTDVINLLSTSMVWPDFYFYIDTQPNIALNRIKSERVIAKPEIGYKNELGSNEKNNREKFIKHQTLVRNNFLQAVRMSEKKIYTINNDENSNRALEEIKNILGVKLKIY